MKKEEIYVVIDSEQKRLRAIQILTDAGEEITQFDLAFTFNESYKYLSLDSDNKWFIFSYSFGVEISLDKLEEILTPKQEIKLDALKLIAESYGFELVEKAREIKVGDFGKFWDSGLEEFCDFGYLHRVQESTCPYINNGCSYRHFRHLTDAEKSQITENW